MNRFTPLVVTLLVLGLLVGTIAPAHAGSFERVDRLNFFERGSDPTLFQPALVKAGSDSRVMIWDQGLQAYLELTVPTDSQNFNDTFPPTRFTPADYLETRQVLNWFDVGTPGGFWEETGQFWSYRTRSDTARTRVPVVKRVDGGDSVSLPDSGIKSIVARGTFWYLQPDSGPLLKWDPRTDDGLVDSGPGTLHGRVIGLGDENRIFTRSDRQIRVYEGREMERSRVFKRMKAVSVNGDYIYVLTRGNRILKLDSNLSIQFTYNISGVGSLADVDVLGNRLFLVGNSGFHVATLSEEQSSFFSSSQNIRPTTLLTTYPDFLNRAKHSRIWVDAGAGSPTIYLNRRGDGAREVSVNDIGFRSESSSMSSDDLPLNSYQYFQTGATFWNGDNRLFYFYPEEKSVEAYDRGGRILRRAVLDFDEFDSLRNVSFLGADQNRIIFEGEIVYPEQGFERTVLIYSWDGELRRSFRLHEPLGTSFSEAVTPCTEWRYDGRGHLYVLGWDYVQQYDLWGYPGQVIHDVVRPTDLMRAGDRLYVMDMNGWRLSAYDLADTYGYRFGTPPGQLAVTGGEFGEDRRVVLTARERGEASKQSILKYNPRTFQYQTVFEHPTQSLRYPEVAAGDTLYFWGKRPGANQSQLFVSDLVQFAARPTGVQFRPGGSGVYDRDRNILIVPRERDGSSDPRHDTGFYYTDGDHSMRGIRNSGDLVRLEPGGFTGYYAVKQSGNQYSIVNGYFQRESDTAHWRWVTSDTIVTSPYPMEQLTLRGGELYINRLLEPGVSELGVLDPQADPGNRLRWMYRAPGVLRWIEPGESRSLVLHRTTKSRGRVVLHYRGDPPTGGVQGQLVTSSPASLSGVQLRTDPGGIRLSSESGGGFSTDGLPVGYVQLMTEGYEKHFSYPIHVPVKANQFELLSEISVEVDQELLLLERGLGYFGEGQYRRARIAFEAYRDLVGDGPYYRLGGIYLKEIYQRQGQVDRLVNLYEERPGMFDARDRRGLYSQVEDPSVRRDILSDFDPTWHQFLNQFREWQLKDSLSTVPPFRHERLGESDRPRTPHRSQN
jgi:hypothetical protein